MSLVRVDFERHKNIWFPHVLSVQDFPSFQISTGLNLPSVVVFGEETFSLFSSPVNSLPVFLSRPLFSSPCVCLLFKETGGKWNTFYGGQVFSFSFSREERRVQNKDWIKKTRCKTRQVFISYVVCQKEDCFFKTTLKTCLNPSQDVFTWLDFFSHLCASLVFVVNVSALLLLSYFSCEKKGSWETIFNATSSLTSSLFFFLPSSCFARRRFDLLVCFQKVQNRQECTRRRW